MKIQTKESGLRLRLDKAVKIHFLFAGLLALQIILYDSAQLITPGAVLKRWQGVAFLFVVSIAVWLLAKQHMAHKSGLTALAGILVLTDVILASLFVYQQRGMASKAVVLYLVAIATIAILRNRGALFATAAICVAAYSLSAIKYFVDFFNEGYKVELYGEVAFYSAVFFIIAALIWSAVRSDN